MLLELVRVDINPTVGSHFGIGDTEPRKVSGRGATGARHVTDHTSWEALDEELTAKLARVPEVRDDVVEQAKAKLADGALDTAEAVEGAVQRLLDEGI